MGASTGRVVGGGLAGGLAGALLGIVLGFAVPKFIFSDKVEQAAAEAKADPGYLYIDGIEAIGMSCFAILACLAGAGIGGVIGGIAGSITGSGIAAHRSAKESQEP